MQSQPNRIVTALVLINLVQYQFLFFSHDKHTNTVRTSLFEHQILHFPNFSKDFFPIFATFSRIFCATLVTKMYGVIVRLPMGHSSPSSLFRVAKKGKKPLFRSQEFDSSKNLPELCPLHLPPKFWNS